MSRARPPRRILRLCSISELSYLPTCEVSFRPIPLSHQFLICVGKIKIGRQAGTARALLMTSDAFVDWIKRNPDLHTQLKVYLWKIISRDTVKVQPFSFMSTQFRRSDGGKAINYQGFLWARRSYLCGNFSKQVLVVWYLHPGKKS